jgi:hypothetical protein
MNRAKRVVLRDLMIFQLKLLMDGMKDIVLSPVSAIAAGLDILFPGPQTGHRFYMVMSVGEKFDRWLNLFGAADRADAESDGLFGASRAGSSTLLGELEAIVLGREEKTVERKHGSAA